MPARHSYVPAWLLVVVQGCAHISVVRSPAMPAFTDMPILLMPCGLHGQKLATD